MDSEISLYKGSDMNALKRKTFELTLILACVLTSSLVHAAAQGNVANTKHNFAIAGPSNVFSAKSDTGMTQVCVFCHTPHNAGQTKLLWNKASANTATSFRLYTSSGSLTNTTRNFSTLPSNSPSLLCLSCHDGKTAMNILHSTTAGVPASSVIAGYPAGARLIPDSTIGTNALTMPVPLTDMMGNTAPSMNLGMTPGNATAGDNLTDDHPIGFSYSDAQVEKPAGLIAKGSVDTKIRFFGPKDRVECSTCHDPHLDTSALADAGQKYFLVKSNTGSALCLSCHNK
jgi:hypothetical protein